MSESVERIRAALAGKPGGSFAEVRAADVVAVGAAIQHHTPTTSALVAGAGAANPANDPDLTVWQIAAQLRQLLDAAGV